MAELKYMVGDALDPKKQDITGNCYIIHVCNDIGAFGGGIAGNIAKKWPEARNMYRIWAKDKASFKLGEIQVVKIEDGLSVINMIAQHLIGEDEFGNPPIRYQALEECLNKVAKLVQVNPGTVVSGRLGSSLAGGAWHKIEPLIFKCLVNQGISVNIYDLPGQVGHYNP